MLLCYASSTVTVDKRKINPLIITGKESDSMRTSGQILTFKLTVFTSLYDVLSYSDNRPVILYFNEVYKQLLIVLYIYIFICIVKKSFGSYYS